MAKLNENEVLVLTSGMRTVAMENEIPSIKRIKLGDILHEACNEIEKKGIIYTKVMGNGYVLFFLHTRKNIEETEVSLIAMTTVENMRSMDLCYDGPILNVKGPKYTEQISLNV